MKVNWHWYPVPGLDGIEASNNGQLRSRRGRGQQPWRIVGTSVDSAGYRQINLRAEGIKRVHVLIAETFHGPRPAGTQCVRHLNGDKLDNRAVNLAWGTFKENSQDALRHGSIRRGELHHSWTTHCLRGHERTEENTYYPPGGGRQCRPCKMQQKHAVAGVNAADYQPFSTDGSVSMGGAA